MELMDVLVASPQPPLPPPLLRASPAPNRTYGPTQVAANSIGKTLRLTPLF